MITAVTDMDGSVAQAVTAMIATGVDGVADQVVDRDVILGHSRIQIQVHSLHRRHHHIHNRAR